MNKTQYIAGTISGAAPTSGKPRLYRAELWKRNKEGFVVACAKKLTSGNIVECHNWILAQKVPCVNITLPEVHAVAKNPDITPRELMEVRDPVERAQQRAMHAGS